LGGITSRLADRELKALVNWLHKSPDWKDRVRTIFAAAIDPMITAAELHLDETFPNIETALLAVESLLTQERAMELVTKLANPGLKYGTAEKKTTRLSANCIGYYLLLAVAEPRRTDAHQELFDELGVKSRKNRVVRSLERYRRFIINLLDIPVHLDDKSSVVLLD